MAGLAEAAAPGPAEAHDTASGTAPDAAPEPHDPWAHLVLDEVLRRTREEQDWLDRLAHRADDPTEEMP